MALPERIIVSLLLHGSGALGCCLNYEQKYLEYEKRKGKTTPLTKWELSKKASQTTPLTKWELSKKASPLRRKRGTTYE